jgi:RNA-directed DNA polymerase
VIYYSHLWPFLKGDNVMKLGVSKYLNCSTIFYLYYLLIGDGFNLSASKSFNKLFKKKVIKDLYEGKIKLKPSTGTDGVNNVSFEKNIDLYIDIINRKVNNDSYKFIPYKEKLINKGKGKAPRIISIPSLRDKLTLATLHKVISEVYSKDINEEIVQTVISKVQNSLKNPSFNYFIKIDIEKFYDNINHTLLLKKLNRRIRKKEIINLITKSIKTPTISTSSRKPYYENIKGVPQGLSISNILATIYMHELDVYYSQQSKFAYFRYVDDILIICNEADKTMLELQLMKQIEVLNLSINSDKNVHGFLTEEFTFLGYRFNNKYAGVRNENIYKLEKTIIEIFTRYKYSNFSRKSEFVWSLNLIITGGIIDEKKYGWLFFYSQIEDLKILFKLDWFIEKQFKRFNITDISQKSIKKFVKTYYEIYFNRSTSKYIPNFDNYTIKQKRGFLQNIVHKNNVVSLDDETVEKYFRRYVFKAIKKLEKDIQDIS